MSAEGDANDAVQSLARIIQAASRLTASVPGKGYVSDPDEEIPHIQANLDHVKALIAGTARPPR